MVGAIDCRKVLRIEVCRASSASSMSRYRSDSNEFSQQVNFIFDLIVPRLLFYTKRYNNSCTIAFLAKFATLNNELLKNKDDIFVTYM